MSLFARRNVKKSSSRKATLEEEEAGGAKGTRSDAADRSSGVAPPRTSFPSSSVSTASATGSLRKDASPPSAAARATASQIREQAAVAAARSHASSAVAARASSGFACPDASPGLQSGVYADLFDAHHDDEGTGSVRPQSGRATSAGVGTPRQVFGGSSCVAVSRVDDASRRPVGASTRGGLSFSGLDEEEDEGAFFKVKKSKASKRLQREKEREARTDNLDRFERGEGVAHSADQARNAPASSGEAKSKVVLQATGLRLLVHQTHLQREFAGTDPGDRPSPSERPTDKDGQERVAARSVSAKRPGASPQSSAGGQPDRAQGDCRKKDASPLPPGSSGPERILSLAELEEAEARHGAGRRARGGLSGARGAGRGDCADEDDVASIARLARAQRQRARMIEKGELIPADSAAALTGEWGTAVRLKRRQQQQLEPLRSWRDGGDEAPDEDEEERRQSEDEDDEEDPAARLKEQLQRLKVAEAEGGEAQNEEEEAWEAWEREKILKGAGRKHLLRQQQLMERRQQEQQVYLQQQLLQGGWAPTEALEQQLFLLQQHQHQQRLLKQLSNPHEPDAPREADVSGVVSPPPATALGSDSPGGADGAGASLIEAPTSAAWLTEVWGAEGADAQARAALEWLKEESQQLRQLEEAEEAQKEERRRQRAGAADELRVLEVRQLAVGKRLDDLQDFLIFVEDLAGFILAKEGAVQQAQETIEEMEREVADRKVERRVLEFEDLRRAFRRARRGGSADSESSSESDSEDVDEFGRSRKYTQKLQRSDRTKARRARRLARRQARAAAAVQDGSAASPDFAGAVRRIREAAARSSGDANPDRGTAAVGPIGSESLWRVLGETLAEGWETSEDDEEDVHRLKKDRSKFSAAAREVMEDVADAFVSVASILEEAEKMKKWCRAEFARLRILEQVPDMIKTQVRWQLLWWSPMAIAASAGEAKGGDKAPSWVCEASLENFDWFLELGLFIDKMDELNAAQDAPAKESKTAKGSKDGSENPADTSDPSAVMSEVVKLCVVPRVAAALKCTDITSFTSVNRAAQLLGELLLFRDENSLPHLTKVLQDFVAFVMVQLSALLPVEFVKQVVADPGVSLSDQGPGTASKSGGEVTTQEEAMAAKEVVELFLHRALKVAGCCTCLVDILSDSLLLHICMQEIFVDRIKPLLPILPSSQQLVLLGAFIHLLPLRWVIQETAGENGATSGRMQQLLGAVVELGEAVVDEAERAEVLLLLKKLSPQEEAEKIQRVFEQRRGQRNPQQ